MSVELNQHLFPMLRYRDARAAIEWLIRTLGCEVRAEYASPDGGIAHAEVVLGASVIGVSSTGTPDAANPWSSVRDGMYVRVHDITRHHARASAAGGDVVMPLADTPYGSREYTVRDVGGHLWAFGTYDMGAVTGAGSPNVYVGLWYPDGPAAMRQLTEAFGFTTTLEVPGTAGRVAHAELTYGGGVVMLGSEPRTNRGFGEWTYSLNVKTDDPDQAFARIRDLGADIVQEPEDTPYGARGFWIRDPEGVLWGLSTYRPNTVAPV